MDNELEHESRHEPPGFESDPVTEPIPTIASSPGAPPSPGWYLDPWDHTHHRYWDGAGWTAETFPNGPGVTAASSPYWRELPHRGGQAAGSPPPPPGWEPAPPTPPPSPSDPVAPPSRTGGRALAVLALAIGLVIGFVIAFAAGSAARHSGSSRSSAAPPTVVPRTPATTSPIRPGADPLAPSTPPGAGGGAAPTDPFASALQSLVLRPGDVQSDLTVQPIARGNQVAGEVTLDLCNASFPSEALRRARLQVAAVNGNGDAPVSTEAVLYGKPADSAQAFTELRAAAASCPPGPTTGASGDAMTTHLNPAPDSSWSATPTVERVAFDFTTTDQRGQTQHFVAVYLRRGRALEGIYFSTPDGPQSPVAGQTTIPGIVDVFARRLAQLPSAAVNG